MSPVLEDPVYRQIVRAPAGREPVFVGKTVNFQDVRIFAEEL